MSTQEQPLVLHICCAPDEAYVVSILKDEYPLVCFFSNPNIQPKEEYDKRLKEAEKTAKHFSVPFYAAPYTPEAWKEAIRGLEGTPEGGDRCRECFLLRLNETAAFCNDNGYTRFTSVMSVSPHKRIAMLNETGETAAKEYELEYVPFDFKKKDGFKKSVILSQEMGIYRQDYCGCLLSLAESEERKEREKRRQGEGVS